MQANSLQLSKYPGTRFMGSKYKVLPEIENVLRDLEFNSVLDAFSGSGCVSYLFKSMGKEVHSNDFMKYSHATSKSLIENNHSILDESDIDYLITKNSKSDFISKKFKDLYFSDTDNAFLDSIFTNIHSLEDGYKKSIAFAAVSRAMVKRRPRGVFTYVGNKFDDGRKDLNLSLEQHFLDNVTAFNEAVFDNGRKNYSYHGDIFNLEIGEVVDLVYMDPPYLSKSSDNDYVRRYHFVEGFVDGWNNVEIDEGTKTKKFRSYKSDFGSKRTIDSAFQNIFTKFRDSNILLSYSSNSIPDKEILMDMLEKTHKRVKVYKIDHVYSFGTHSHKKNNATNRVQEYLFLAER